MEIYMIEFEESTHFYEINAMIYICNDIDEAKEFAKSKSERKPTITNIGTAKNGYNGYILASYNPESVDL